MKRKCGDNRFLVGIGLLFVGSLAVLLFFGAIAFILNPSILYQKGRYGPGGYGGGYPNDEQMYIMDVQAQNLQEYPLHQQPSVRGKSGLEFELGMKNYAKERELHSGKSKLGSKEENKVEHDYSKDLDKSVSSKDLKSHYDHYFSKEEGKKHSHHRSPRHSIHKDHYEKDISQHDRDVKVDLNEKENHEEEKSTGLWHKFKQFFGMDMKEGFSISGKIINHGDKKRSRNKNKKFNGEEKVEEVHALKEDMAHPEEKKIYIDEYHAQPPKYQPEVSQYKGKPILQDQPPKRAYEPRSPYQPLNKAYEPRSYQHSEQVYEPKSQYRQPVPPQYEQKPKPQGYNQPPPQHYNRPPYTINQDNSGLRAGRKSCLSCSH